MIRFRGWAARNGLFWGDDGLLYKSARAGRLVLRRQARGWSAADAVQRAAPWHPASSEVSTPAHPMKTLSSMNAKFVIQADPILSLPPSPTRIRGT